MFLFYSEYHRVLVDLQFVFHHIVIVPRNVTPHSGSVNFSVTKSKKGQKLNEAVLLLTDHIGIM